MDEQYREVARMWIGEMPIDIEIAKLGAGAITSATLGDSLDGTPPPSGQTK